MAQNTGSFSFVGELFARELQQIDPEGAYVRSLEVLRYAQSDIDGAVVGLIKGEVELALSSLVQALEKIGQVAEIMSGDVTLNVTDLNAESLRNLGVVLGDIATEGDSLRQFIEDESNSITELIESSFESDNPTERLGEARLRIERLFVVVATALGFDLTLGSQ